MTKRRRRWRLWMVFCAVMLCYNAGGFGFYLPQVSQRASAALWAGWYFAAFLVMVHCVGIYWRLLEGDWDERE